LAVVVFFQPFFQFVGRHRFGYKEALSLIAVLRSQCAQPKAMASANTMAYIITAKYADGLPLYRLSEILKRHHIDFSRQTLSA